MSHLVSELPRGWINTLLGDVVKWGSGGTPRASEPAYYGGSIPWAIIGDLNDGTVTATATNITEQGLNQSSAKWVSAGSILVAMYGSIGKLGIAGMRLTTNQAIAFCDPTPINPKYLFWYLLSQRKNLLYEGKGGTQSNISQTVLKAFPFVLAPLVEQGRIVVAIEEHLSRHDVAVAGLRRVKRMIIRYRASLLQSAVDGTLSAQMGIRFDASPRPLGDLLDRIEAGRSFRCEERPPRDGEVGVVKVSAVSWGVFDEAESKTVLNPDRIEKRFFIRDGDFLFSRANTIALVGACVIVSKDPRNLMLSDKILRFVLRSGVNAKWLLICLRSQKGRTAIERLATGNQDSMRNIGQDRIKEIVIPLPTPDVCRAIVAEVERRLDCIDALERVVETILARAVHLRQAVLKRAFEGKLVLQDARDEPASLLVERILTLRTSSAALPTKSRRSA